MENLSLDDQNTSSTSSSSHLSRSDMHMFSSTSQIWKRFKRSSIHSELTRKLMDQIQSPFLDIPKTVMDLTSNSVNYILSLGFRFMPGQSEFVFKSLKLPDTLDGLKGLSRTIFSKRLSD